MRTVYYIDGSIWPFTDKDEAEKAELAHKEKQKEWQENWDKHDPRLKLEKLIHELKECMNVWEGTMATCSFDSIRVKGMVRTCQAFAKENKEYLNYY